MFSYFSRPMEAEPRFLDPHAEVTHHSNRLPHWQQNEATYFVTFRLADSVPVELLREWQQEREAWMRWNPEPWSPKQEREHRERFAATMERLLDAGHGECLLRQSPLARIVGDALQHFDGVRYDQHSWVVMPNHVHALFSARGEAKLPAIMKSWKTFTGRTINGRINRTGSLWQKDYRDRIIRSAQHFLNCARYIRNNPKEAALKPASICITKATRHALSWTRRISSISWERRLPSRRPPHARSAILMRVPATR